MKPATYREVRTYSVAIVDRELVERASGNLRMKRRESSDTVVRLSVRLNIWSYGERVEVSLGTVDGKCVVDIRSSCAMPFQIADWGKNERNVRRLFNELDVLLGNRSAHEPCCLCNNCNYLLVGLPSEVCPECGFSFTGDSPGTKRHGASFWTFLWYALVVTGIEFSILILAALCGADRTFPQMLQGIRGGVFLLWVNLGSIIGVFVAERVTRRLLSSR